MAEEDSKPPASTSTIPPRDADDDAPTPQQKRRKENSGRVVVEKDGGGEDAEVYDVAEVLGFRPGDRFEVKWTIFGDNEDAVAEGGGKGGAAKEEADGSAVEDHDGGGEDVVDGEDGGVTVWWAATLVHKTDRMHDLADDERGEGKTSVDDEDSPLRRSAAVATTGVRVPIYKLNYAPLEEHGFDCHSVEDVAFVSERSLLNLSTDEIMTFRREGMPSPPSSPTPSAAAARTERLDDESDGGIARVVYGQDQMMELMNRIMQRGLKNTGIDQMMKALPASQQLMMAERIARAKEGMLENIMEESADERVITEEVVRRCMERMKGGY